jgi:hypothetical protein
MQLTLRLPKIKLLCYLLELARYYFSKQVTKGNARAFLAVVLEVPAEASTAAAAGLAYRRREERKWADSCSFDMDDGLNDQSGGGAYHADG